MIRTFSVTKLSGVLDLLPVERATEACRQQRARPTAVPPRRIIRVSRLNRIVRLLELVGSLGITGLLELVGLLGLVLLGLYGSCFVRVCL